MKPDLHTHSYYSDGQHSPQELIERAVANGVTHLAITDHDCLTQPGNDLVVPDSLSLIPGVEISSLWSNMEVHIVGLFIDQTNAELGALVHEQQRIRKQRAEAMDEKLCKLGTTGLLQYLEALPSVAWTRTHVADFLIREALCATRKKAFKEFLGKQGKLRTRTEWASLERAVGAINKAGGIAVLAHPSRYRLNRKKLIKLLAEFKTAGGAALEVSYPNLDINRAQQLQDLAAGQQLYLSCGSDFHDAAATWTEVGKYRRLPHEWEAMAIWQHPSWGSVKSET